MPPRIENSLSWRSVWLGGWLFLCISSTTSGQFYNALYKKDGAGDIKTLGSSVGGAGDVDRDSKADFIVGAPGSSPGGRLGAGSALIYSGATGLLLHRKDGAVQTGHFGRSVAGPGDINGDTIPDFVVGEPRPTIFKQGWYYLPGVAHVFSGATGDLLCGAVSPQLSTCGNMYSADEYGFAVAGVGDITGDGKNEFIVGGPKGDPLTCVNDNAGWTEIWSEACYNLATFAGLSSDDQLGYSVAGAGDVNGDGKPDMIISAPFADPSGRTDAGSVYIISGLDFSILYRIDGRVAGDKFGISVSEAGDVNGDGKADLIIGAPLADRIYPVALSNVGSVYIFSGADTSLIYQLWGTEPDDHFGSSVAGTDDINGDSKPDFIVGAPGADPGGQTDAGSAYIFSGLDGFPIDQKNGMAASDQLGFSVAGTGDVNGDGKADFIIGAPYAPSGAATYGTALVYVNCPKRKGDMNNDGSLTPSDIVLLQNCVSQGSGDCNRCFADMDCDGDLDSTDISILTAAVYEGTPLPC